jgi:HlyD family secretion protein
MLTRYLLPVAAAAALVFAAFQVSKAQQKPPPAAPPVEPARSPFATAVAGAGIVEPETENISIGTQVPGLVERVAVRVGQSVRPGDPLFQLDDRQLQAELGVRRANLDSAKATLAKLDRAPRPAEVPPVEARVSEAKAGLKNAQSNYDRIRRLTSSAVSEDELTNRVWSLEVAQAQLAKAEADLSLLKEGTWEPDKLVAAAAVRQSEAAVAQTRTEIDRLVVRAPLAGPTAKPAEFKVLQVSVRPGEFVGAVPGQALIVLGHVGQLHVRVDIDENDIPRFRPELPGVAKPRGEPGLEFPLTFVRVEPYVIPKKSLTGGNTERVDTRVLQVIYALDTKGKPLYVGQQMDVFLNGSK